MTDQDLINKLATDVMGWEEIIMVQNAGFGYSESIAYREKNGMFKKRYHNWNPLKDWNHTAQVLSKMTKEQIPQFSFVDDDAQEAICLAALETIK